jgi:spore coat protein A
MSFRSKILSASVLLLFSVSAAFANSQIAQVPLPGKNIPKFVDQLPSFAGARVPGNRQLGISMEEFQSMVLPATIYSLLPAPFNGGTYVWGYEIRDGAGALVGPAYYPAFTIEAVRNAGPTSVTYTNNLQGTGGTPPVLQKYITVDQSIHWADPLNAGHAPTGLLCTPGVNPGPLAPVWCRPYAGPVPAVTHLHGGEVHSTSDGGPDAWFTPGLDYVGPAWASGVTNFYTYPNTQEAATLWYHDHALGATRLNVYAGLAGFYFLRDGRDTGLPDNPIGLPAGPQEIEIAIQDRMFDTNGQWFFPDLGINPEHPFWIPEFFGDAIVVNGKTWPYLNVEPKRYRFHFLDGSNARFYTLQIGQGASRVPFWQIGTDGGLLDAPVMVNQLTIAPGERADVLVDFTGLPVGTTLLMTNSAKAPFPGGKPADPQTVGQIMQFRVVDSTGADTSCNPALAGSCLLRPAPMVRLAQASASVRRQMTLNEVLGAGGPLEILVNNTKWDGLMSPNIQQFFPSDGVSELPRTGATEIWQIINLTADTHPIHTHLTQFQLMSRQPFQTGKYLKAYGSAFGTAGTATLPAGCVAGAYCPGYGPPLAYGTLNADGAIGGNPAVTPYLQGAPAPPAPNENGWKDTVRMNPGEITTILVRWAPTDAPLTTQPGDNLFAFDPTTGPGYVWHCHIVDHEDNEMMRPYKVVP